MTPAVTKALALAALVRWSSGDVDRATAEGAWAVLYEAGLVKVEMFPGEGWLAELSPPPGVSGWTWGTMAEALGPLGVIGQNVAGEAAAIKAQVAQAAARAKAMIRDHVVGGWVLGGVFVLGSATAIAVAVAVKKRKDRRRRAA